MLFFFYCFIFIFHRCLSGQICCQHVKQRHSIFNASFKPNTFLESLTAPLISELYFKRYEYFTSLGLRLKLTFTTADRAADVNEDKKLFLNTIFHHFNIVTFSLTKRLIDFRFNTAPHVHQLSCMFTALISFFPPLFMSTFYPALLFCCIYICFFPVICITFNVTNHLFLSDVQIIHSVTKRELIYHLHCYEGGNFNLLFLAICKKKKKTN